MANRVVWGGGKPMNIRVSVFPYCFFCCVQASSAAGHGHASQRHVFVGRNTSASGSGAPGKIIAGDKHNPDGYYEWDAVVAVHERLLIDLQRWWPASEGTLALPEAWLQHPATCQAYSELRALVTSVVDQQKGVWAIKDFVPADCCRCGWSYAASWLFLCDCFLAVRDPAEVVTSLVRRDGPLVGMEPLRAQHLWWCHNLEAVYAAQQADLPLAVVDFDRWFQAPELQLKVLEQALPELRPSLNQRQQALALINPEHRRSLRPKQAPKLQDGVRRLHRRLLRQPLPKRWPALQPSFEVPDVVPPNQAETWPDWLAAHRSFPAPRLTERVFPASQCLMSVCGSSWLELRPHLLLQYLPFRSWDSAGSISSARVFINFNWWGAATNRCNLLG